MLFYESEVNKMGVANKYNKTKLFSFSIPSEYEYISLSELYQKNGKDKVYPVLAMYINKKSRYGEAPILATDENLVNIPTHMLDTVKTMMNDEEVIDACNNKKLGFTIYQYVNRNNKELNFSINWVDM